MIVSPTSSTTLATFEIQLNEHLHRRFGDEWLISTPTARIKESLTRAPFLSDQTHGTTIKLRISCSFDAQLVARLQRGLWPTCHSISSASGDDTAEVSPAELLMVKSPLGWSQALQNSQT